MVPERGLEKHQAGSGVSGADRAGETVKPGDVYREAARLIAEGEDRDYAGHGSCCAIADALYPDKGRYEAMDAARSSKILIKYEDLFAPSPPCFTYWAAHVERPKQFRILALCFAAAMADAGDLP